jgi:hypothetical protein
VLFLFALVAAAHQVRRVGASPVARRLGNAAGASFFAWLAARLALAER